ncbi:MAG TPA: alpha/beta fold hydrolase [Nonomuraea sp.]|nr:alpha/beta fold hydrolase [Nonomuraea sp.]
MTARATPSQPPANPWFNYIARRATPRQRLVCLAGAGSGPSEFATWAAALPEHIEVWPVQLPGREQRLREEPWSDLPGLVAELMLALKATERRTPLPLLLLGHSFGALIMYELACQISLHDPSRLSGLVLSGLSAPDRPARQAAVSSLSDAELLAWIRQLEGTPLELLDNARFTQWLIRDLRASYRIRETYPALPSTILTCPITVFGGSDDFETSEADLDAWSTRTSSRFRRHILPGGHFFLRQERERFLRVLAKELDEMAGTAASGQTEEP